MKDRGAGSLLLYLLRHAHAGDPAAWPGPDDRRPLSAKGRAQAERLGAFLASVGFAPDVLITSPMLRAVETAEIVGEALGRPVRADPRLAGPLSPATVDAILEAAASPVRAVLVGHDPDFSDLFADLVGGTGGGAGLRLRKGAIACLATDRPLRDGAAELRWLLPPDVLER